MRPKVETATVILFYLLLLGGWQLLFSLQIVPDYVFPAPSQVAQRIYEIFSDNLLLPSIRATFGRMLLGFSFAVVVGLGLGIGMGMSDILSRCLKSLFLGLLTLPTAAWSPIALLLFGLNDKAIYFVIIMSAGPAIAISASEAIRRIPLIYVQAAQTLGTSRISLPFKIILPAAFPSILTGVKLGWTLGWHGAVSAELIKSTVGLGFLLQMGRELNDAPQVLGIMGVTILIGLFVDRFLFGAIERRVYSRWGLSKR